MNKFEIHHLPTGSSQWHLLECNRTEEGAKFKATNYALDHGGRCCVTDRNGRTIFEYPQVQS
jgi:hypothetical protein